MINIIEILKKNKFKAIVAPELEFYLCEQNLDPDLPLKTPVGKSGRRETGSRVFGIDAVNEFDALTDDIYDYCELMNIGVDTLVHESGPSQIEINLNHGDSLALADQAFMFSTNKLHQNMVYMQLYGKAISRPARQFNAHTPKSRINEIK